ncbi:ABC transporter substrate-binding protein [Gracilibacillus alcaliphilus]|uniref:ABC transporter substrate-binding protein n=1 Tax=Gracilibacillus alcaliphilus TaxID=1401441 RepID=UPI00195E66B0|nr:extracellular solute-binding protein [Gracilibacillus alcaliphilus]MBM7678991.1 multiple sugar transport system substrate-binding protein [Gracilibacillus alcaliphilus]
MSWKKGMFSLFLVSLVLMLAACGNNDASNEAGGDDDGSVTINYYTWEGDEKERIVAEIIENFEAENPDIKVNYETLVSSNDSLEFYQQLDIKVGTGDSIDVVAFSHVDFLLERAARGVLAPLDDFMEADSIDPTEEYYVAPQYDGQTFGIQDLSQPWFVAINKDALDAAGLDVPEWGWTWDDFQEYAAQLTTDDQYGAYFHTWGEFANFPAYAELPHPYLTDSEEPVFDHPVFADFFDLRREMEEEGSVRKFQDVIAAETHYATEFFNEEAAMLPIGSFIIDMIKDKESYPHDFQTVFAPIPRSSEDVEIGSMYMGGHYLAVGESSEHKEESYKFAKYMAEQVEVISDFPGSRHVDQGEVIDTMIGDNADLIDQDTLAATVYDDNIFIPYDPAYSTAYSNELKSVLEDGFSQYILDGIDSSEAQEAMVQQANDIIDRNQ